nr:septum site-determining protein MinC [Thermosyntropha lipolytica]
MKKGLKEEIRQNQKYRLGDKVNVYIGYKNLSQKQIRELEDILLDYGLHLKELMTNGPPGQENSFFLPQNEENAGFPADMPEYEETALIRKNLRSGQKCFARGNIVILGDVNPGAEVIAGGNILVMGVLRGMAHAGAFGDEKAIIAAYRLIPTQLRIANHITRPPDGEVIMVNTPELARIRAGKVVIEKLKI